MRYMNPPLKNKSLPFRVYSRERRLEGVRKDVWKFLASFVWKADAKTFMENKQDSNYEHKVMHGKFKVRIL